MFQEAAVMNWLSKGAQPAGFIIRLQGFGRGIFGGNFHTHNSLHIPPGLDVVCYSNGRDYARGWRYLVSQAQAGRMCMSVDCTHLLNLRHVHGNDNGWLKTYPELDDVLTFDEVITYGEASGDKRVIVTYGNGVIVALQAQQKLRDEHNS